MFARRNGANQALILSKAPTIRICANDCLHPCRTCRPREITTFLVAINHWRTLAHGETSSLRSEFIRCLLERDGRLLPRPLTRPGLGQLVGRGKYRAARSGGRPVPQCSMHSECRKCRKVRGSDRDPHKALFDVRPESGGMSYCRLIASKNWEFVLVAFRRSMRNSIAATSSIGASSLRRIHTF